MPTRVPCSCAHLAVTYRPENLHEELLFRVLDHGFADQGGTDPHDVRAVFDRDLEVVENLQVQEVLTCDGTVQS